MKLCPESCSSGECLADPRLDLLRVYLAELHEHYKRDGRDVLTNLLQVRFKTGEFVPKLSVGRVRQGTLHQHAGEKIRPRLSVRRSLLVQQPAELRLQAEAHQVALRIGLAVLLHLHASPGCRERRRHGPLLWLRELCRYLVNGT